MRSITLSKKLAAFGEYWQPRTVDEFNGHDLMVMKVKGLRLRDGQVMLGPGEMATAAPRRIV
jgi:hypothetical protein